MSTQKDKKVKHPPTTYATKYPYNRVETTESGHQFEIDDTPGKERLRYAHKKGTYFEISPDGRKVELVVGDNHQYNKKGFSLTVDDNGDIKVGGNCRMVIQNDAHIEVQKNASIAVGQDLKASISRNAMILVEKEMVALVEGSASLHAKGNMNLKVDGDWTEKIAGNKKTEVMGNVTEVFNQNLNTQIGQNNKQTVGGEKETLVSADYGLKGAKIKLNC